MAERPPSPVPPPPQPVTPHNSSCQSPPPPQRQTEVHLDSRSSFQPQQPSSPPPLTLPPSPPENKPFRLFHFRRPPIRYSTEYDSENRYASHKVSSKFFDGLAKLKFSFLNSNEGKIVNRQVSLITKHLSVHYDVEELDAVVEGSVDVGSNLQLTATHIVKAQRGEVGIITNLVNPAYKLELASAIPSTGLPKVTLKAPFAEVSMEGKDDEEKRILLINGCARGSLMDGVCTGSYNNEILNLRYLYKDEEMTFIPSISMPLKALEQFEKRSISGFAFKRRFGPSSKLSYWYEFDSNNWSTVYKHTMGKDYRFKVGYDSKESVGSASLWVGDYHGKAKTSPMKANFQVMVRVPQDLKSLNVMFWIKKRWDI